MNKADWDKIEALWEEYMHNVWLRHYHKYPMSAFGHVIPSVNVSFPVIDFNAIVQADRHVPPDKAVVIVKGRVAGSITFHDLCSLDAETEALARDHDDHFWPHKGGCPLCGSDAYVGFVRVECSNGGCGNFFHREGM